MLRSCRAPMTASPTPTTSHRSTATRSASRGSAPDGRPPRPGLLALLGSGETSPAGRKMHDALVSRLPRPATVAILETPPLPADVDLVELKIVESTFSARPAQLRPAKCWWCKPASAVRVRPGRSADAHFVLPADYIFLGPGSPTYTRRASSRQFDLRHVVQRDREGATLAMGSAAALAAAPGRCRSTRSTKRAKTTLGGRLDL